MTEADYYTPPQAARVLGLSSRRVTQMLNNGSLNGEKSGNGRWKIPAIVVAQLLKERSQKPLPPPRGERVDKALEEVRDRAALLERRTERLERRIERLADSLSRSFTSFERLEVRLDQLEQSLNRQ